MTDEKFNTAVDLKGAISTYNCLHRSVETGDTFDFGDIQDSLQEELLVYITERLNHIKQRFELL
jgi:hypothetical protein